ncbi:MAG: hypothetical protein ACI4PC_00100 [Oscillospiraceae bacterium]
MAIDRKKLVAELLDSARNSAFKEAQVIKAEENISYDFLFAHIRSYVLSKYLLPEETAEEDIKELARMSLARTMKLDKSLVRELDQQTPCNQATSEATKKVLLLYALQKDLDISPDPAEYSAAKTLGELAQVVYPLVRREGT